MKAAAVAILALLVLGASARGEDKSLKVDQIDEYVFKFLDGFEISKHYENSSICRDSLALITDSFISKVTGVINSKGEIERQGLIDAGYAMGILPDFARHCDGLVSYIVTYINQFVQSFDNYDEYLNSFTENATLNFMELM